MTETDKSNNADAAGYADMDIEEIRESSFLSPFNLQNRELGKPMKPVYAAFCRADIEKIDYRFAEFLHQQGEKSVEVLLLAALCSRASRLGSVCLDLDDQLLASFQENASRKTILAEIKKSPSIYIQDVARHCEKGSREELLAVPLVFSGNALYFQRNWLAEQKLASRINCYLSASWLEPVPVLSELTLSEKQYEAVKLACQAPFSIITGGPGTGKTTIVASIIKSILEDTGNVKKSSEKKQSDRLENENKMVIRLAAPTGKAAMRLQSSLGEQLPDHGLNVSTLHSLLGASSHLARPFHFNGSNKLPVDMLIIDETSMVDMAIMLAVMEALPDEARLVLLGDPSQLPSIGSGQVFSDLCQRASNKASILSKHLVELDKSFRFDRFPEIGQLAQAVLSGDIEKCREFEKNPPGSAVQGFVFEEQSNSCDELVEIAVTYEKLISLAQQSNDLDDYRSLIEDYQVLSTVRNARQGTEGINNMVEQHLCDKGLAGRRFYPGLKVMILDNHPELGLFNGDTGVVIERDGSEPVVGFYQANEWKFFESSQLPAWEPCFAITAHKAQGSEFKKVVIVLPANTSERQQELLSKQLLYTAVTRARESVVMIYSESSIERSLSCSSARCTGLVELFS